MNHSSQQLERIVAYLDGELSAEESAQVEQQLAADEEFRQELQGAERAWSALDELPMAQVGESFAQTTMEMVVTAARNDVQARTIALPLQRRNRKAKTALLATMMVLFGALVFRILWNNPNRRLLADLPVIHNVDIYSQFQSVEFLQQLDRLLGKGHKISESDAEQIEAKSAVFEQVSTEDGREDWLELLPDDEKIVLRAKLNRFRDLSHQKQTEMRQLHQQIVAANDREQLLTTMFRYQQWLSGLSQSQQYEYRELAASGSAIRVAREIEQAVNQQQFELTQKQLRRFFRQVRPHVQKIVEQNKEALDKELAKMPKRDQRFFRARSKPEQVMWAFQYAMRHSQGHVKIMKEFNEVVVGALPEEMRESYQQLPFWEKADLMRSWLWQARSSTAGDRHTGTKWHPGEITEQEFSDFFVEELEPAEKERLLALPRDKMQQQLERMMLGKMRKGDRRGPPGWDGPPPPHRGPRGGPGFDGPRPRRPPPGFERPGVERRDFERDRPPRRRPPPPNE